MVYLCYRDHAMLFRKFSVLIILLAMGVAVFPIAKADDAFGPKVGMRVEFETLTEKQEKDKKDAQFASSEEDEEEGDAPYEWNIIDQNSWETLKKPKLERVSFRDMKVTDFVAFLNKQLKEHQLPVSVKYLHDDTSKEIPQLAVLNLDDVSIADLLIMACHQMRCVCEVDKGEVCILPSKHKLSKTYSVTRVEIIGRGEREKDVLSVMKDNWGFVVPEDAEASFNKEENELTVVAPLSLHSDIARMCQKFDELRNQLPEMDGLFKKYCTTLRKVCKSACKVKPGKNARAKFKKLRAPLGRICTTQNIQKLMYYVRVKPNEYKKLQKMIDELSGPMQDMLDALSEQGEDSETIDEASTLFSELLRFSE